MVEWMFNELKCVCFVKFRFGLLSLTRGRGHKFNMGDKFMDVASSQKRQMPVLFESLLNMVSEDLLRLFCTLRIGTHRTP